MSDIDNDLQRLSVMADCRRDLVIWNVLLYAMTVKARIGDLDN
jgi:hypothetical protein